VRIGERERLLLGWNERRLTDDNDFVKTFSEAQDVKRQEPRL
jgi:hypothetical protein